MSADHAAAPVTTESGIVGDIPAENKSD
jgi:hypothetical protein